MREQLSDPDNEIGINEDVLKEHAFGIAAETISNADIYVGVGDELYKNMPRVYELQHDVDHIMRYPSDTITDYAIHFCGQTVSYKTYQTSSGSRHHPAEYKNEYEDVLFTLIFYPAGNGGLGSVEFEVEL